MRARLIKLLGGYTKQEHDSLTANLDAARKKVDELLRQPKFCTIRPDCVMQEGHGGTCMDICGLRFTTLHQHELRRKRRERDRKALEELTAQPEGVSRG